MTNPTQPKGAIETDESLSALYWWGIALVSIKVLWGIWSRDLSFGDTSQYFLDAARWTQSGRINIVWSPLYTSYFGFMDGLFEDARASVLLHRVVLVVATTLLAAWTARRFLTPALAFLVAVWWAALPIHYDTLYEVHLFASIVAFAAVAICSFDSAWRLPLLVALYGLSAVLVRNENIICFAILGAYLVFRALEMARAGATGKAARNLLFRLAVLAVLGIGLLAFFHQISHVKGWREISAVSAPKHRVNMCQVYAYGYQQRHPDWAQSPWTECRPLMKQVFDRETPSIAEMFAANPGATLEHFMWNLSLTPAGLQVLFFNATSFGVNPDYAPVFRRRIFPAVLSLFVLAVIAASAVALYRRRGRPELLLACARGADFAVLFAANALMALAVILTQRPRPSYLLGFAFICAIAFFRLIEAGWPRWLPSINRKFAWIVLAAALLVPSYRSLPLSSKDGRLAELYGLFRDQRAALCNPGSTLAIGEYSSELRNYLCRSPRQSNVPLESMGMAAMGAKDAVAALRERAVDAVIVDRIFMQSKTKIANCTELDAAFQAGGWKRLIVSVHRNGFCDAAYVKTGAAPVK